VCVDDNLGMIFNNRRQSQDRVLREYILKLAEGHKLWMNHYSAQQFELASQIDVNDNFLDEATPGEYCFVEDIDVKPYKQQAEKIVLFKWNRRYPGDLRFGIDLSSWNLNQIEINKSGSTYNDDVASGSAF